MLWSRAVLVPVSGRGATSIAQLTSAELTDAIRQSEGVMEALPPDVKSGTDGRTTDGRSCRLREL